MNTEDDIYRRLQEHLDRMPVGYPATESGVEIRVLKHLFTPEEARIALHLSAVPEPLERIYRRVKKTGMSIEQLEQTLDRMVHKGAILGGRLAAGKGGEKRYSKAQLAIGMYEFQVDRLTRELQEDVGRYMVEGFAEAFHSKKTSQMRTIPIGETITPERQVGNYDSVREIIQAHPGLRWPVCGAELHLSAGQGPAGRTLPADGCSQNLPRPRGRSTGLHRWWNRPGPHSRRGVDTAREGRGGRHGSPAGEHTGPPFHLLLLWVLLWGLDERQEVSPPGGIHPLELLRPV